MFNQCAFVGRLGKDPVIKYFDGGKSKTSFNIAVDRPTFGGGEKKSDWFRVEVWGKSGELAAEYLKKGSVVAVGGRLEMEEWEGRDGKMTQPTLKDATWRNLTPKEKAPAGGQAPEDLADDVPF